MVHEILILMLNVLYLYITISQRICAVPRVTVFCSSLISCFPGMFIFLHTFPCFTFVTFGHILSFVALTVTVWSTLRCLVVTFISLRGTRFSATLNLPYCSTFLLLLNIVVIMIIIGLEVDENHMFQT